MTEAARAVPTPAGGAPPPRRRRRLKRLAREDETEGVRDAANVFFGRARADKR
jgi:hypothetical protein